jgi:hypothetical protein
VNRDDAEVVQAKAEELRQALATQAGMLDCKERRGPRPTSVECSKGRCVVLFP